MRWPNNKKVETLPHQSNALSITLVTLILM